MTMDLAKDLTAQYPACSRVNMEIGRIVVAELQRTSKHNHLHIGLLCLNGVMMKGVNVLISLGSAKPETRYIGLKAKFSAHDRSTLCQYDENSMKIRHNNCRSVIAEFGVRGRMKVLISGAGIAGTALAFWLSKLGHDVTVIERFTSLRTTGLQIDLRGHGIEVMKRMGLEESFRSKAAPEQGLQVVDKSGRRWAYFPANKPGDGLQNFTTEYEIMRGDLCRIMYDATKERAKYIFGTTIESFEDNGSSVEVRFTDSKTDRFDLLVGADGQGSRIRKMMLGHNSQDTFCPIGRGNNYMAYFTISKPIQDGEQYTATSYIATGGRVVMTRRHSASEVQVYLSCSTDSERLKNARRGDVEEEKEALTEIFQGAGWQTDEILNSLKGSKNFYCERLGLVKMESWSSGHVTLVGDAAYCPTANTGMGTTSAIVGAYILAGEIGRYCRRSNRADVHGENTLVAALKEYEQRFRPFMNQVQEGVAEDSFTDKVPWTPFTIAILNFLLGVASFFRVNIFKWLLKENVKGWDLPEYEEMLRN
ncbi:FAD/NAD(P)-binding domain-containing protein [Patellaria atrata CBS 101060]|uniref:FAD/NAD(P)-binding domain-containing protein n=1 Tax=Patellaria atrata CBS 101060 TaxID=1346257 RepID=A0A9P4S413_9PEZI|nr:FAD/NAD(P)-binding domain-containing protein [Patellaria atrata CBS 101060]